MRHALFVAFHYPPEGSSSGVLRTLKYTRYLARFGWRVTVLTVNPDAYEVTDKSLELQVPPGVQVIRTRFLNVKRHLAIRGIYPSILAVPDRWIGWWPWGIAAGKRILRDDSPDLIYSTSPHATAHLIALVLARRGRLRWVADFRDPWYEEPPEPGTSWIAHKVARRLERMVIRRADRVVASTVRLRDTLSSRYSSEPAGKFKAIPNGYDEDDFRALAAPSDDLSQELMIVHAGSLNPEFRDPRPVFDAIRRASEAGEMDARHVRLRFLGGGPFVESPEMRQAVARGGLASHVEFRPRVPYETALAELGRAGILLLLQASPDTVDLVPAKLFEYLRTGRPVLAIVRPGAVSEVIEEVGGGWAVDPRDTQALQEALVVAYRAWSSKSLGRIKADRVALQKFSRESLTAELAAEFDSLVSSSVGTTG